jgi:two-component system, NarL family, sensor histidine kinase UhpB
MPNTYKVLHVDDSPEDAILVRGALAKAPFECSIRLVDTEPAYVAELDSMLPDVIVCDYNMPQFSAERALAIMRERGLDIPFIIVSHHLGESAAVIAMQQGASDYLPKASLERLGKAIEGAVDRSRARREMARAQQALRESEALQRGILDSLQSRIALLDRNGRIVSVNRVWREFQRDAEGPPSEAGADYLGELRGEEARGSHFAGELAEGIRAVLARETTLHSMEYEVPGPRGSRAYFARVMPLEDSDQGAVVSHTDISDRVVTQAALQVANRRLQALSKRVLAIQEDERRAISRELHDDVGQTMGALKIGLHRLERTAAGDDAALVAECLQAADNALGHLRAIAMELRPPQLDQLGLEEALGWLADRQAGVTGLEIRCKVSGLDKRPPPSLEGACYRIAQEALNNATRHASASNVSIGVESDGRLLKLVVRDNGVGFDEDAARKRVLKSGSMGLIGMEERALLAGGRLKIRTVPGGGTTVSAIFPLEGQLQATGA